MLESKLTVRYGKKEILNLSLSLNEGINVLFGKNGTGKSTLLHALTGTVSSQGTFLWNGTELKSLSALERAKIVSLLPQILPSPDLPVKEVVELGRFPYGKPSEQEKTFLNEIMVLLDLTPLKERLTSTLSGGERQKVFLAMLLAQDTPLILLDEPTTYMDISFRETFFSLLSSLKAKKKTVLLVSHDLSLANIADRILLLENGKLTFDGTKGDCFSKHILENAFSIKRYEIDGKQFFQ